MKFDKQLEGVYIRIVNKDEESSKKEEPWRRMSGLRILLSYLTKEELKCRVYSFTIGLQISLFSEDDEKKENLAKIYECVRSSYLRRGVSKSNDKEQYLAPLICTRLQPGKRLKNQQLAGFACR